MLFSNCHFLPLCLSSQIRIRGSLRDSLVSFQFSLYLSTSFPQISFSLCDRLRVCSLGELPFATSVLSNGAAVTEQIEKDGTVCLFDG